MSGIAHLLLKRGFRVSGSDLKENRVTDELKRLGAKIFVGHQAENITEQEVVVYSSAIRERIIRRCVRRGFCTYL